MTTSTTRRLSPGAAPNGSAWGLLAAQARAEVRQNMRAPEFMIGVVALPVILYAMFGLPEVGDILGGGTDVGALMLASMSCFGVISLAIFTFGVDVAQERGKGWLRHLRATPMPMWAYFGGKCAMALVYAVTIVVTMIVVATVGGAAFDVVRLVRASIMVVLGVLAFSSMGFALAYWTRPRAATAIGNLVFLPLAFVSGLFYTLNGLPTVLQNLAPYLPTYHFGQLVWNQLAPAGDVRQFGSPAPDSLVVHATWVAGWWLAFAALAVLGYRRDLRRNS
jgi:ABC-2 type transport system permease protein